jgi:hypothetical protein
MSAFGEKVSLGAKWDHPYQDRTGNLTSSIGFTVEVWKNNTAQLNIYATATYADEVEYGTSKSKAYPFLFPKLYEFLPTLQPALAIAAERAIRDGGIAGGANPRP